MTNLTPSQPVPPLKEEGDATGGVIPYKNPRALTAYYLGLFSLFPAIGFILACFAIPLGISGLRERKKRPAIRGVVHAWIGIIVGGISAAVHLLMFVIIMFAILARE